jgi:hypothetical protein
MNIGGQPLMGLAAVLMRLKPRSTYWRNSWAEPVFGNFGAIPVAIAIEELNQAQQLGQVNLPILRRVITRMRSTSLCIHIHARHETIFRSLWSGSAVETTRVEELDEP